MKRKSDSIDGQRAPIAKTGNATSHRIFVLDSSPAAKGNLASVTKTGKAPSQTKEIDHKPGKGARLFLRGLLN